MERKEEVGEVKHLDVRNFQNKSCQRKIETADVASEGSKTITLFISGSTIPPSANLIFNVELVEIVEGKMKRIKIDGPTCLRDKAVFNKDLLTIEYSGVSASGHTHSTG